MMKIHTTLLILLALLFSCTEEEFTARKKVESSQSDSIRTYASFKCTTYTLIKPQVDYLFLWDNSGSLTFITEETRMALNHTIELISDRFDYRVVLAPLVGSDNNSSYILTENPTGINSSAMNRVIRQDEAYQRLSSFPLSQQLELGAKRVKDLLKQNYQDGVFRDNANTVVVVMSNGDDQSVSEAAAPALKVSTGIEKANELRTLAQDTINSQKLYFFSIVAYSKCQSGYKPNYVYKTISEVLHNYSINPDLSYSPSSSSNINTIFNEIISSPNNSFDICGQDFTHIFDGVNNSVEDTVVAHEYNYWPVATSESPLINPDKISVVTSSGKQLDQLPYPAPKGASGFTFQKKIQTVDTRFKPTPGEPFTGYVIQLHEDAVVKYPECLTVYTESKIDYYGYIQVHTLPLKDSIKLKINGVEIKENDPNGWSWYGYHSSLSVLIQSPTDYSPANPPLHKTGYFIKLHGSAVYSNGASVELTYDPCTAGNCY